MRTHFCLFLSCLFCFALLSGCGKAFEARFAHRIAGSVERTAAERAGKEGKAGGLTVLKINGIEYFFRWCPPGTFKMGDEDKAHQVTLTHGFWMLETQVTQEMWEKVMGNNPSNFKGAKLPVEQVSWNDSQEFITKLNALLAGTPGAPAGFKFSLPTEAQWEYACRAGTTTAYSFGDTLTQQQANFGGYRTKEVGSYPANAWGLYDMHGNVYEWCQDLFCDYPSGAVTDPTGADRGSGRVIRGGSWYGNAQYCRSAYRDYCDPSNRYYNVGIRLSLVSQ